MAIGKWTPEGGGLEKHPSRMSSVETTHVSEINEPMQYCCFTIWSITKRHDVEGDRYGEEAWLTAFTRMRRASLHS
jgi:hypothetical protein